MNLTPDTAQLISMEREGECKGVFLRYRRSAYMGGDGSINMRDTFRLLKSKSCPGCDSCYPILDSVSEHMNMGLEIGFSGLASGDMVTVSFLQHTDRETGAVDDVEVFFVKVKDEG